MRNSELENAAKLIIDMINGHHPDDILRSERHVIEELHTVIDRVIFDGKYGRLRGIENSIYDIRRTLDRLENKAYDNYPRCEFSKAKYGFFPEFISAMAGLETGTISPNPDSFLKKLSNIIRSGTAAVIVDPYILAEKDDSNTLVDVLDEVLNITQSSESVYLFCRKEHIDQSTMIKMKENLGVKLKGIFTGDIHDRYIFVGYDEKMDNSFHRPWIPGNKSEKSKKNKELKYWRGAAFGASLNGVTKRPTYILNFSGEDLGSLFAYLDYEMTELQ